MISILDYGMGNLRSVEKALVKLGQDVEVVSDLSGVTRLIIPGVGAFGAAMERLRPLKADIQSYVSDGGKLLGICLGQQLLFETSEEHGAHDGLELLSGRVQYFPKSNSLKIPHIGWSALDLKSEALQGNLSQGSQVYFVHSLVTWCDAKEDIAATAFHGIEFTAAVRRGNIWGMQFHPEKSSSVGLTLLQNWLDS